jgi:ubiquitin carboxyl-terminal hydrolase 16/45
VQIIKKRQPPPPKDEKGKSTPRARTDSHARARSPAPSSNLSTIRENSVDATTDPALSLSSPPLTSLQEEAKEPELLTSDKIPEEERLRAFTDMLFGGSLASILVCDSCKKVSVTQEDFNDLSLPIKPEEYAKASESRKNKFRKLAQKLKLPKRSGRDDAPPEVSVPAATAPAPLMLPHPIQELASFRSSSVPPSPMRRDSDVAGSHDESFEVIHVAPRRRSIDATTAPSGLRGLAAAASSTTSVGDVSVGGISAGGTSAVETVTSTHSAEPSGTSADEAPHSGDESTRRGRVEFVDRDPPDKKDKNGNDNWTKFTRRVSLAMGRKIKDGPSRSQERGRSRQSVELKRDDHPPSRPRSATQVIDSAKDSSHATERPTTLPARGAASPALASSQLPRTQSPLPSLASAVTPLLAPTPVRPNANKNASAPIPQRPPQPSKAEAAYLRRILADVPSATSNPLAIFLGAAHGSSSDLSSLPSSPPENRTQALWSRLSQLTTVEECLRMFTAVEVLEGENMVGCRRCWKIANGVYKPRPASIHDGDDADSEEDDEDEKDNREEEPNTGAASFTLLPSSPTTRTSSLGAIAPVAIRFDSSQSVTSTSSNWSSVASDSAVGTPSEVSDKNPKSFYLQPAAAHGVLPIPVISTTAPDTPDGRALDGHSINRPESAASTGSLLAPSGRRMRADSGSDSDSGIVEFDGGPSEASSAPESPFVSPTSSREHLPLPKRPKSSVPKSKQVILRRAYKRYLIATPPPVLVIHLKRFQQISKAPVMSFGLSGFQKLDDYVAFPEYLDLTPFLAPRKEDFGLKDRRSKSSGKDRAKKDQKCMYRLYAVVEHLGNMVGNFYYPDL